MRNLLLLHGALGHNEIFNPYLETLSAYFTIHSPLFSGHGETKLGEDGISIEKYTEELAAYCKKESLNNVYIFGHSMGGYVALCYALKHSDNINSIMTLGTKFDWTEEQALTESKMLDPETILLKIPKYAEQLETQHGPQWKRLLPAIADMMIALGKNPPLDNNHLSAISIPVQIMIGDKDNMVSLAESAEVYKAIPNAKLAVLPDTKHPMDKVRPTLLLDLMKDFWNLP
ncbi:alpha/beta fold hydrolase [Chryseobacterium populi]|uniref:Putative hydrolase or acyltransferase of alpha/beta superfamily n=1 Tax=Chryseobacterium populi TaxID=1144316 RepID=J3CCW9_9FLAO|nr:alpha/beta hydrolase [Chryseobacterium populi]EJL69084.1 putative hydrolase or acyltransferase of alpha/beta superfamily [Chryseobacterium populi]